MPDEIADTAIRLLVLDGLREFYSTQDAETWLRSPHKMLDGQTPEELIRQDRVAAVLALISQLRDGAVV